MEIKNLNYNFWNLIKHDLEVDTQAEEDDLCFYCGGYLFLLEKNRNGVVGYNNILFEKISKSKISILELFREVQNFLAENNIDYIRVEGSNNRYNWMKKYFECVKDNSITDRNVQYCKIK